MQPVINSDTKSVAAQQFVVDHRAAIKRPCPHSLYEMSLSADQSVTVGEMLSCLVVDLDSVVAWAT